MREHLFGLGYEAELDGAEPAPGKAPGKRTLTMSLPARAALPGPVQRRVRFDGEDVGDDEIDDAAARGIRTASDALPFLDRIQVAFGRHRVDHVQAHRGADAAATAAAMNAEAYAVGDHVVLGEQPTLHTVAHEAAHVVQQRAGVARKGGGDHDAFELHADAVADAVVAGRSAEALLDELAPGAAPAAEVVQRKISFRGQAQFSDLAHLRNTLYQRFAEAHHAAIDGQLASISGWAQTVKAVWVFNQIVAYGNGQGWTPVAPPSSSTSHGPQLPRLAPNGVNLDPQGAMSSFAFSSVTLARADLILPDGQVVSFEGRNDTKSGDHAEDVVLRKIDAHLEAHELDPAGCRVRITINNLPCGPDEKNCSETVRAWAAKFESVHLYYANNYGKAAASIANMRKKKRVKVSQFAPRDALAAMLAAVLAAAKKIKKKEDKPRSTGLNDETRARLDGMEPIAPADTKLDPWSDSEDDEEEALDPGDVDMGGGDEKEAKGAEEDEEEAGADEPAAEEEAPVLILETRGKESKGDGRLRHSKRKRASNDVDGDEAEEKLPAAEYDALPGTLQNVDGAGLNCLIRALLVASGLAESRATVNVLRDSLVDMDVAQYGRMLDLAGAAGAVLISRIAPSRGVHVYVPAAGGYRRHVIVGGPNPVTLYLAGEHFQAIV